MENLTNYFIGTVMVLGFITLAYLIVEGLSNSYHMDDKED